MTELIQSQQEESDKYKYKLQKLTSSWINSR